MITVYDTRCVQHCFQQGITLKEFQLSYPKEDGLNFYGADALIVLQNNPT